MTKSNPITFRLKNITQTQGVFKVPKRVKSKRVIRNWRRGLEELSEQGDLDVPLVLETEDYTRQSVMKKLGPNRTYNPNRDLVRALMDYRMIRSRNGKRVSQPRQPILNLSLSQTISGFYGESIENIHLTKEYLQSNDFMEKPPKERVKILFNAYTGARWFETFRERFRTHGKNKRIYAWHNLRLRDIHEILGCAQYESGDERRNIVKLVNKGMIILQNGTFKLHGTKNFVNPEGLAELTNLLQEAEGWSSLVKNDPFFNKLVQNFAKKRLTPYLKEKGVDPLETLTAGQIAKTLGVPVDRIVDKIQKGLIKRVEQNRKKRAKILGVDFAIYACRKTNLLTFTKEDVAELFGYENINPQRLGFHASNHNTYARHQYVFPLYDKVAEKARQTVFDKWRGMEKSSTPFSVNGDTYYITRQGKNDFCKIYSFKDFNPSFIEHFTNSIMKGNFKEGKYYCPNMVLTLNGRKITAVSKIERTEKIEPKRSTKDFNQILNEAENMQKKMDKKVWEV